MASNEKEGSEERLSVLLLKSTRDLVYQIRINYATFVII